MQKVYPKVVILKKGLVGVALFGILLIMMLIIHNLYKATHHQTVMKRLDSHKVEAVASQADTRWYQDKKGRKVDIPAQSKTHLKTGKQKEIRKEDPPSQETQDLLKAMSAPIGSNQIIAEKEPLSADTPLISSALHDADQNGQSEKKAFLQSNNQMEEDDLGSLLKNPMSPYVLQAGTLIPGILITGINSDLPGQMLGQVRSNVYDSPSGKYLLIPQGSRLIGLYDSQIVYGQERVLIVWKRLIFPNGQSINLQGMPGIDMSGYAGFNDQVNHHYRKIVGSVILMSMLGAGAQLSAPQNNNNPFATPTIGQTVAQSVGNNLANTGAMLLAKDSNNQPTLAIRSGYKFNISVTKDMIFPGPYHD